MKKKLRFARELIEPLRVAPGAAAELRRRDPGYTDGLASKREARDRLAEGIEMLSGYQDRLAAQDTFAVLLVLQGLDGAGKDSTIKHVMSGLNPSGVEVRSFKQPSGEELEHDFLWRHQRSLPQRGRIGIFNRSHYEEVLVVRVHPELLAREHLPDSARGNGLWKRRYRAINDWERHLVENGIRVVKVFLHLSRQEQARRFLRRIEEPEKNWKFSISDIREREHWDAYQRAYEAMLGHTSTEWAPWHVVPADHKWFARLATAAILVATLDEIDPRYPTVDPETRAAMLDARGELLEESS